MAEKIIKKKVELPELFYDLVFAYAISQTTDLLYHFKGNLASIAEADRKSTRLNSSHPH